MKKLGEVVSKGGRQPLRSARRRAEPRDGNFAFVRAFADALRDILLEERRRVA